MTHLALTMFIMGSFCILLSTTERATRGGDVANLTRAAATFFIFGSLLLW